MKNNERSTASPSVPTWVQMVVYALVFGLMLLAERLRWVNQQTRLEALTGWLAGPTADWLPFIPVFLLALFCRNILARKSKPSSSPVSRRQSWSSQSAADATGLSGAWIAAICLFVIAFVVSRFFGAQLQGLPPAYHDEFSYLFQAQTDLAGRWWFPSYEPHPEWFDQMHVLNEGHFASRYFPGVGFWMAPFVAMGDPWLGHQLAQAIAAMLVFWIGRELSSNGVGILAGLLFAFSPGLILFSNLLLAHHPALVGLLLFCWAFLRWMRCRGNGMLLLAGSGLSFAMLCRPMTAAGFGLPFGILFAWWWLTGRSSLFRSEKNTENRISDVKDSKQAVEKSFFRRTVSAVILAIPLLIGFLVLAVSNRAITGSYFLTPYQLYTDIYTPRHRYGFNNVVYGEQHLGPKVLDNYDRWAENLTPVLAIRNVWMRLENSLRWSMGIVPLLTAGLVCLLTLRSGDRRWGLIWGAVVCLHVVHVPYWFAGIMGWHYVFETAPLWILIFSEASRRLIDTWRTQRQSGLVWWWGTVVLVALAVNLVTIRPLWPGRLEQGLAELEFPKRRYAEFRNQVEELRQGRDAIVLVLPDESDRHIDYVTNPPNLKGPVLVARIRDRKDLDKAIQAFPDRVPIIFDAAKRQFIQR